MKVVLIGPIWPFRGGIAQFSGVLCKNFEKKHDLQMISFSTLFPSLLYPGKWQKETGTKKLGYKVDYVINAINPLTWFTVAVSIAKNKPDRVIFTWWTSYLALCYFFMSAIIKCMSTAKIGFLMHHVLPHGHTTIDKILLKLGIFFVDYFVTLSQQNVALGEKLTGKPFAYVPLLMYEPFFQKSATDVAAVKRKYGLGKNVLLFFGFVRQYKGLWNLLHAMPSVLKKLNVSLLVVGEFWEPTEKYFLEAKKLGVANKLKIVDNYVPDKDVWQYFAISDAVVMPYASSTTTGMIQLAYLYNKPIIASYQIGDVDMLRRHGTAVLAKSNEPQALSEAIIKFYNENLAKKLASNIRKHKNELKWNKLYEKVILGS